MSVIRIFASLEQITVGFKLRATVPSTYSTPSVERTILEGDWLMGDMS